MFTKILIANRGEIACRIIRTAQSMGMRTAAVYSDVDTNALHVAMADEAWRIGPASAPESYLRIDKIIEAAKLSGSEAIHPGYGFLSENADFAEACEACGLVFIGPPAAAIRAMGLKDEAKRLMRQAGVPIVPGSDGDAHDAMSLASQAARIGYPVLIKAIAGGGGKGMRLVEAAEDFEAALAGARREAKNSFGDDRVLIEKFISPARHLEVQIFADIHGNIVHLFERDCSLQRRHQKVIEEAPAPGITDEVRAAMGESAIKAAAAVGYRGAGTVEFVAKGLETLRPDNFWFMEMNTRLQVEHPVTEMITGQDLVAWQLRIAAGERLPLQQPALTAMGHAIEARIYAEDPGKGFLPASGTLDRVAFPQGEGIRIDTGVRAGDEVTPHYDPLLAKIIVSGSSRSEAIARLSWALEHTRIVGCTTNLPFLAALARHASFVAGRADTALIARSLGQLLSGDAPPQEVLVLAAIHAAGGLELPDSISPWTALAGFRLWDAGEREIEFKIDQTNVQARVQRKGTRFKIAFSDRSTTVDVIDLLTHAVVLNIEGRRLAVECYRRLGALVVFSGARSWAINLHDPLQAAAAEHAGDGSILSPMPGLVVEVKVRSGDKVVRNQPLIVIEAMKMEYALAAPADAVVTDVFIVSGQQVDGGTVLLKLNEEALVS